MPRPTKALNEVPEAFKRRLSAQEFSEAEIILLYLVSKLFPIPYLEHIAPQRETIEVSPVLICQGSGFLVQRCYAAADRLAKKGILVKKEKSLTGPGSKVYYLFKASQLLTLLKNIEQ